MSDLGTAGPALEQVLRLDSSRAAARTSKTGSLGLAENLTFCLGRLLA
jgi:hypothetical protein